MKRNRYPAVFAVVVALAIAACTTQREGNKPAAEASSLPDAPAVVFKSLEGKDVGLAEYKGKVVLLNFWATWCEPCKIEIPWFIEFQQKYGARGFTVLGVAMDDEGKEKVVPYLQKERFEVDGKPAAINYPIVLGNDAVTGKFGVFGYPTTLVIARDGKIVKRFIGLVNHEYLVKEIERLL